MSRNSHLGNAMYIHICMYKVIWQFANKLQISLGKATISVTKATCTWS